MKAEGDGGVEEELNKAWLKQTFRCQLAIHELGLLTHPAVAGAGSLAELQLKIYYHMWGGAWA